MFFCKKAFDFEAKLTFFSLSSLAVRVPHNVSRRVLETQTPNPWLDRFRSGFIVKPIFYVLFLFFEKFFPGKTNGFFTFFNFSIHLHKEHYKTNPASIANPDPESVAGCPLPVARYWFYSKTNGFSMLFGLFACKTNDFSTISVARSIRPMLF